MTDKTELLPCPKCFGEAEILGDNMIACKDHECGIQMDWGHWCGKGAREKLILGWNKRAAPSPTAIPAGIPEGMVLEGVPQFALGLSPIAFAVAHAGEIVKNLNRLCTTSDDWVVVPREPTDEMIEAADGWGNSAYEEDGRDAIINCYRDMLSTAAPTATPEMTNGN